MKPLFAVIAFTLLAPCAFAQGCLPPEQPYPFEPPTDDPELRAIVRDQYRAYIDDSEDYMNCLQTEFGRAHQETRQVLDRWILYFGNEPTMSYDESGSPDR